MTIDDKDGTWDSGHGTQDSGNGTRDTGSEKLEVRCGIQDSFAGYKFEDVIREHEKEEVEKAKTLAESERLRKIEDSKGKKNEEPDDKKPSSIPTITKLPQLGFVPSTLQTITRNNYGAYIFTNVPYRYAPNGILPEVAIRPRIAGIGRLQSEFDELSKKEHYSKATFNYWKASPGNMPGIFIPTAELLYQLMKQAAYHTAPADTDSKQFTQDVRDRVFTDQSKGVIRRSIKWITGRRILTATTLKFKNRNFGDDYLELKQDHPSGTISQTVLYFPTGENVIDQTITGQSLDFLEVLLHSEGSNADIFEHHVPLQRNWKRYINMKAPRYKERQVVLKMPSQEKYSELETRVTLGLDRRGRFVIDCTQPADTVKGYIIPVRTPGVTL